MSNKKLTPQHKQILNILLDGQFHCGTVFINCYIKDDRKRISELNEMGFVIIAEKCDGRCLIKHNSGIVMRQWTNPNTWFDKDDPISPIAQKFLLEYPSKLMKKQIEKQLVNALF